VVCLSVGDISTSDLLAAPLAVGVAGRARQLLSGFTASMASACGGDGGCAYRDITNVLRIPTDKRQPPHPLRRLPLMWRRKTTDRPSMRNSGFMRGCVFQLPP